MQRPTMKSKLLRYNSSSSVTSAPTHTHQMAGLTLRVDVLSGRNLAAKDRSGTSDPVRRMSPRYDEKRC